MTNRESAACRYWATVAAQIAGINLFVAIGLLAFPVSRSDIAAGLQYILGGMWLVFALSLVAFIVPFYRAWKDRSGGFRHTDIDLMIFVLFLIDIIVLTFLVCQEGGLDRSMFVPVFFLISIAYMLVERHEKRQRLLWIFSITIVGVLLSYYVSRLVTRGLTVFPVVRIPITNFPDADRERYNNALLIVTFSSLAIPIFQMQIMEFFRRKETC